MEDWGEETFPEAVSLQWKKWVKRPITIQGHGIENLVYRAFRSKIRPVLQASY